mgnify:FL=1
MFEKTLKMCGRIFETKTAAKDLMSCQNFKPDTGECTATNNWCKHFVVMTPKDILLLNFLRDIKQQNAAILKKLQEQKNNIK